MEHVLIAGFGSIGQRHARNLLALGVRRIGAFDPEPSRRKAAEELGIATFAALEGALDAHPSVVFVCTPPAFHVEVAAAAAERGCHLFIEKPLSDRVDGVDELVDAVRRQRLASMVACNLRFHPGLGLVKELLEDAVAGRVVAVRAEFGQYLPDWHPREDYRRTYSATASLGGGVILDAIHEIDYCRWLMGEVDAVACFAGKLSGLEVETEDVAALLLHFSRGAIGEIHVDYVQRAYSRTFQVIGDAGTLRWDYGSGETKWYTAATQQWRSTRNPEGWEPNRMYVDELRHFLECFERGTPTMCDVSEGRRVLEIALAARRSAAQGRSVSV